MENVNRAVCRAQVTKLCNQITDYLKTIASEKNVENVELESNVYLQRIKNAHENLKRADEAVRATVKQEEMVKECESVIEYDDKTVTVIAQLECALKAVVKGEKSKDIVQRSHPVNDNYTAVKLKGLDLKKFNGNFENWLPFWEQFKVAVHDNPSLNAAAKFNFLSESLVGAAAAVIIGFTPTESCYEEAIALLQEEYGNNDRLVEKYLQKLLGLKPVASTHDVKGLRFLYNEVIAAMRSLAALQVPSSKYDMIIKSVLLKAIPVSVRVQYHRSVGSSRSGSSTLLDLEEEQLKPLLEFIKVELEALEKSQLSERDKRVEEKSHKKPMYGTATALLSTTHSQTCIFCKKSNHATKNCRSNMSTEQRKNILKREGRCFRCGNKNHSSKFCKAQWIKCEKCSGRHLTPMCERSDKESVQNALKSSVAVPQCHVRDQNERPPSPEPQSSATLSSVQINQTGTFLQTAKAIVGNVHDNECFLTRLIMDNGSQRSYISEKLVQKLKLKPCGMEKVNIIGFGDSGGQLGEIKKVEVFIRSQYRRQVKSIVALVVPNICVDILPIPKIESPGFRQVELELADKETGDWHLVSGINLLIGQDYYWEFNENNMVSITRKLKAVKTFFGWTIQGRAQLENDGRQCALQVTTNEFDVSKFWDLESLGIKSENTNAEKVEFDVKRIGDRYVVKLPWKDSITRLNNNKVIALSRLRSLTFKLLRTPAMLKEYDSIFREQLAQGLAEAVPLGGNTEKPIYYMPHKPVHREDHATTKMRIVFDASSAEQGQCSLNDLLSPGENLVADLVTMLVRFRSNKIALVADIEKAFLQISLDESDRDTHRFLWYSSQPKSECELPEIREFRMTRVTFGVTSSPFLLAMTIRKHLDCCQNEYGTVCQKLHQGFYVDDLVVSVSTREEALMVYSQAKKIMDAASFRLRKWNSSDATVRNSFDPNDLHPEPSSQKVLGLRWNTVTDEISVDVESCIDYLQSLRGTKRNVMRAMAKIFDPLGFIGPFTVRLKILLQDVWKERPKWDSILSEYNLNAFSIWQSELEDLREIRFERSLSGKADNSFELHIFADASPKAFGVVSYIRQISSDGSIKVNFICSKNRVSPIGKMSGTSELTLPKLELTAALMAARLKTFLLKALELEISAVFLWTDSTIALNWIYGCGKPLKPYIKARVTEINNLTNIYDWRHCQGKDNPADLVTRGIKAKALVSSTLWQSGPHWMSESKLHWPKEYIIDRTNLLMSQVEENTSEVITAQILPLEEFCSIKKLLRVTAFILRFVRNMKKKSGRKIKEKKTVKRPVEELTYAEISEAEMYWIKAVQREYFKNEIKQLSGNELREDKDKLALKNSKISSLNPYLHKNVLRLRSRIVEEGFGMISRPIILPKSSHFCKLLVLEAHYSTLHGGVNMVLAYIRKRFWIIQSRQLIRQILHRCVTRKKLHGKNATEPWGTLPLERLKTTRPFETTGIDFAGPLYIKADEGGEQRKVYVLLLTCAAVRAVHLELVSDLTVRSCIDALRRFFARRGVPKTVISDNARTFKRVDKEFRILEGLMKQSEVQRLAAHSGITWKYIPERAPWWGGFWERLVRSVKDALKAAIGRACLKSEELETFLVEVESVINARPLTYISTHPEDLNPLTPSHFLTSLPSFLFPTDFNNDGSALSQLWADRQILIKQYFKRWQREYLLQLRSLHIIKRGHSKSVQEGEIVLVQEDGKPRMQWKLGLIERVYEGRDGRVRACEVRTKNQTLRRPIQRLYPLEISTSVAGGEDVEN